MSSADQPTISAVEAAAYAVPTDAPEADGTLSWDATTVVVVEVAGGGGRGLGWSYTAGAAVGVVRDLLADVVVGRSAMDPRGANEAMNRAVRNVGRPGIAASAISALDVALWDLQAKLLGVPLHRLLGGNDAPVPVYGSGGFTTYDEAQTTHQVTDWLQRCGVTAVKIKVGESWGARPRRDLERVELVRKLVGADRDVFVDANGGYSVGAAVRIGRRYDDLGVTWFEEPVSSDDLAGLREVRRALNLDVAAGEYGYDLTYFDRMLAAQAVDCLQIDVTRCGGITEFLRAAAVAAARGFDVSAHCAPHLHAAFAGVVPRLRHIEYFHDHIRIEERLLFDGAEPASDGCLRPADRPGLGLELRAPDADQWRVA
ncbi:MAG TPA: enolase C-terminal domain-like protein [Mycobacteriales bacterium]|jgi:L-alanine-DL-glutamate epimerase-like enolase superfamily enzyme|nr:enolase C-terminal domain-like protein [Mycobacteriales bacterium]